MTPSPTPSATNEELLRKVIEAQVRGGCETWEDILHLAEDEYQSWWHNDSPILEILLDTQGAKAAYGEEPSRYDVEGVTLMFWEAAQSHILLGWNTGGGNNVRAALETAVSFLPTP